MFTFLTDVDQALQESQESHEDKRTLAPTDNEDSDSITPETNPAEMKQWWEDQYIIAPGFESKMEGLIQSGGLGVHQSRSPPSRASDIGIIKSPITMNPNLRCYVHEDEGNVTHLPPVKSDSMTQLLSYYPMDAASILPVLALDLRPDEEVLDMCAGPGGKTLAMLQTMCLGKE